MATLRPFTDAHNHFLSVHTGSVPPSQEAFARALFPESAEVVPGWGFYISQGHILVRHVAPSALWRMHVELRDLDNLQELASRFRKPTDPPAETIAEALAEFIATRSLGFQELVGPVGMLAARHPLAAKIEHARLLVTPSLDDVTTPLHRSLSPLPRDGRSSPPLA